MQDSDAYECPVGHYCPANTTEPIKCPVGTFSNQVRLMEESECTNCTQGERYTVNLLKIWTPEKITVTKS